MKKFTLILFIIFCTSLATSQNQFWQNQTSLKNSEIKDSNKHLPKNQTYTLNLEAMQLLLKNAPARGENTRQSSVILSFPNSEGEFEQFRIIEASVMAPVLQLRYPNIRSYAGQGIADPSARIRFSVSPQGLHSMRLSANKSASFIVPLTTDNQIYTVYSRADRTGDFSDFECTVTESANNVITGANYTLRNANDAILRTYDLAVSATGEYTQYHGGTKAQALAAIVTTMTRVNGIFETDFNVTMVLIGNTDDVIYESISSDPYGNTTGGYNTALQSTLTSVIGESNYDIGHLFANLQNNGNAGCIGCVCVNGQKGSGWTSAVEPEGEFFDVDYVAHEMGHQFGANHTWTHGGNEGTNVQVEPGSGSTIMSYAGITGATDVQANVTPNFHAVSIEQVTDYVKSTTCQTETTTGNAVPTVNAGLDYIIPKGTPFILEGTGTDADIGDVLSYCWEQMDENNASTTYPSTTNTTGVAFRAYEPVADSHRYFPRLETIKTGATSWQWEAVPDVARTLNFRLTVRDNVAGGGTNNSDDMVVTVNGTAGPFVVSSPNTNLTWDVGSTQTVTWDVAGTTGNGINAVNVDIYLSTDGGNTYPIILASNVANDGSHDIIVPNNPGSQNRVMVKGANNMFFDISNADFTINIVSPTFLLSATPDSNVSCVPALADYTIDLTSVLGFNSPVTLSTSGLPAGSSDSFSVNPVTSTGSSILTIDPGTASFGTYNLTITGIGGGVTQTFDISYSISSGTLATVTLSSPTDNELSVSTSPTLNWNTVANADDYEIDIATDISFSNIVFNQSDITNTSTMASGLSYNTNYFWRVRAVNNCTTGSWSTIWQFTTQDIPPCTGTVINTFTYLETFDSGLGDWSQGNGDDGDWVLDNGGTPSAGTGPSDDITVGGNYLFLEASENGSPGEIGANATAIFESPCFDLSGLSVAFFNFNYHLYGATMGSLALEISDDNGTTWTNIFSASGDLGDSWQTSTIDLVSYLGSIVKFRFAGTTGNGFESDMAIDHISITDQIDYCASNGSNFSRFITGVQLNTINNINTGDGSGYSDFTNINTDLFSENQYTITITPNNTGNTLGYSVWIDYNRNGSFDDVGEQVFVQSPIASTGVSGNFTVPLEVSYGSTRMRVSLRRNGIPPSCGSFNNGEVEDYTIDFQYDGLLFTNDNWTPNPPTTSTGSDNALVLDGTYTSSSDISINDLIVNTGATVEIDPSQALTVNGDLTINGNLILNSNSTGYSSLLFNGTLTGDIKYKRHVNAFNGITGNDLIASPLTGQNFGDFANDNLNIYHNSDPTSEKLFGPFNKTTGWYQIYDSSGDGSVTLDSGVGYRAARDAAEDVISGTTFTFTGSVNTGNVDIGILNSGPAYQEWNLIGNPYPSYIILDDFLSANNSNFDTQSAGVYGYNAQATDKWEIWNQAFSDNYEQENPGSELLITPGQGFFVASKTGGATITFTPSMRTTGSSDDFISGRNTTNSISHLKLKATKASDFYETDFYFTDNASLGLDVGYDAGIFGEIAPGFAIYSHLVSDNQGIDMAIQSISSTDLENNTLIPLGINTQAGEQLILSIEQTTLPENINVYLEDTVANTITLLNTNDFMITPNTNLNDVGRFFLRFETETLSTTENELEGLVIFNTNSPKVLHIKGQLSEPSTLYLYNIQGQIILSEALKPNNNAQQIDISNLASGVYIAKIDGMNQIVSKKVIIK